MKTRLYHEKGRISLLLAHGSWGGTKAGNEDDRMVLAAMTHLEGTGCWRLIDIRLCERPVAHPWSGSCIAEDFYSEYRPESADEAKLVKSRLKEFEERPDGTLIWCTYRNIVRGERGVNGYTPPTYNNFTPPVYHGKDGALAKLKGIQAFWEMYEGTIHGARMNNPYLQPSASRIESELLAQRIIAERKSQGDGMDFP